MIVLNATPELKLTFDKLIQTMEAQVSWNGLFVVIDNTLILQGDVRSLFFHFDSRKVVTNIIHADVRSKKPEIQSRLDRLNELHSQITNIKDHLIKQ